MLSSKPWSIGAFFLLAYSVWLLLGHSANVVQAFAAPGFFGSCSTLAVSIYFILLLVWRENLGMTILRAVVAIIAAAFAGAALVDLWRIATVEGVGGLVADEWMPATAAMLLSTGTILHAVIAGCMRAAPPPVTLASSSANAPA